MTNRNTPKGLSIQVDRAAVAPIGDQIHASPRRAILDGRLAPGQRLPSGRDLAAQLGVARGTIRVAYDRLIAETWYSAPAPQAHAYAPGQPRVKRSTRSQSTGPWRHSHAHSRAHRCRSKWAYLLTTRFRPSSGPACARVPHATTPSLAPPTLDPRGEPALRARSRATLVISRQTYRHPDQIIITSGYRQGLLLVLTALRAYGRKADRGARLSA